MSRAPSSVWSAAALLRLGGLPASWLTRLRCAEAGAAADAWRAAQEAAVSALDRLGDVAGAAIAGLDDREQRRALLQLRRDAHNRRATRLATTPSRSWPAAVAAAIDEARAAQARAEDAERAARAVFAAEERTGAAELRRLASEPDMIDAVASAAPGLEHELAQLARGALVGKRLRHAENTVALYLTRAAGKTSPRARLGWVACGTLDPGPLVPAQSLGGGELRHTVLLNLAWVDLAHTLSARAHEAPLMLASCQRAGAEVLLVRRDEAVRGDLPRLQGSDEKLVRIRGVGPLLELVAPLLPAPRAALEAALAGRVASPEAALERLLSLGLLVAAPVAPMQAWNDPGQVARGLVRRGPVSLRLGEALARTGERLPDHGRQPASTRTQLTREIGTELRASIDAAGGASFPTPSPVLFEDSCLVGAAARLGAATLAGPLADLVTVLEIADATSLRHARRRTLAERLRRLPGAPRVPLLQAAAALLATEATPDTTPNPLELPDVAQLIDARERFRRAIAERVERRPEGTLQLAAADLRRAWGDLGIAPPPVALAEALVQIAPLEHAPLVLTGALQGGGRLFSRFLAAADEGGTATAGLRAHLDHLAPAVPVELCGVHGFNANLHPPLCRLAVDYPGLPSVPASWPSLRLDELDVSVEGEPGLPVVRDRAGREIALLDLGFLSDYLKPPLRRWLGMLCAQAAPDVGVFRVRGRDTGVPGVKHFPRVCVGGVVISRARWRVPLAQVPAHDDACEHFAATRALLARLGASTTVFARAHVEVDKDKPAPAATAEFEHKPIWLDAGAPVTTRLLARMLRPPTTHLELVEALPRPDLDGIVAPEGRRAAEWVIELALHTRPATGAAEKCP